jgi:endoglucanase
MRSSVLLPTSIRSLPLLLGLTACASSTTAPNNELPPGGDGGSPVHDAGQSAPSNDAAASKDASKDAAKDSPGTPAESGAPTGGYSVSGATVLDSSGKPHLFRGLSRPSLEFSSVGDQLADGDYGVIAAWGANVVRIPLNQGYWLQADANGAANPSYDPSYAGTVDQQVQAAEHNHLDVILDLHGSDTGNFSVEVQCNTAHSNCQQMMADTHSLLFWKQVAAKYKNDPHVLFELYNEPHIGGYQPGDPGTAAFTSNWTVWLNGGSTSGFQAAGMQQLYDAVRGTGAPNLVIVGGLDWAFDLRGISSYPVNGTNVLYATHAYQQNPESNWDGYFGSLAARYPIIATEFGDRSGSCSTAYASDFIAYANKKATSGPNPPNEISWTAWAFYVASNVCTFPTLLTNYYAPNAAGTVVMNALMAGP